jgi:hypothetical protein
MIGTFKRSGHEFESEIATLNLQSDGVRVVPMPTGQFKRRAWNGAGFADVPVAKASRAGSRGRALRNGPATSRDVGRGAG